METNSENVTHQAQEGSKIWEYLAILVCWNISVCFGIVDGWNSPTDVKLTMPDSPIPVTPSNLSTLVAMSTAGIALGPLINVFVTDRIGRKNSLLLGAVPQILNWGLITIATSIWVLYVARFLSGIFLGLSSCIVQMYIGEVCSPETRGAVNAILLVGYNIGVTLAFIFIPYLSISTAAGIGLGISVGATILACFTPESPYFLLMKNRLEKAEKALAQLRGKPDVSKELESILVFLRSTSDKSSTSPWKGIFTIPGNRRAFFILVVFDVAICFGGFFTILNYGELIFRASDIAISDYIVNISVGITQLVSSIVIIFFLDKFGRRPLILLSGIVGGISSCVVGGCYYAKEYMDVDLSKISLVPVAAVIVMVFMLSCGMVSLQMVMLSELFATDVKAVGTTLIGVIVGVFGAISSKLYIVIAITWNFGHSVPFLGFAVILWSCTGILLYYTPETKGKTLAQIQEELNKW